MIRRGDDRAGGLPRPVRRLLRFAEIRDGRSRRRPQIGVQGGRRTAPKLLADATRLVPSARPSAPEAAVPGRPLLRAVLPAGPPAGGARSASPTRKGREHARSLLHGAPAGGASEPARGRPRPSRPLRRQVGDRPGPGARLGPRRTARARAAGPRRKPAASAGSRVLRHAEGLAHGRGARIVEGPRERPAPGRRPPPVLRWSRAPPPRHRRPRRRACRRRRRWHVARRSRVPALTTRGLSLRATGRLGPARARPARVGSGDAGAEPSSRPAYAAPARGGDASAPPPARAASATSPRDPAPRHPRR